jgi:hypothetical protein
MIHSYFNVYLRFQKLETDEPNYSEIFYRSQHQCVKNMERINTNTETEYCFLKYFKS